MGEKLKPCPFCGGVAYIEQTGNRRQSTIYECESCGCRLETGEEFSHGKRWNERSESDEITRLRAEVAALADQNKVLRDALENHQGNYILSRAECKQIVEALNLPDLATPAINRIKAKAYREAAEICETTFAHGILQLGHRAAISQAIRAKADELEQSK